LIDTVAHYRYIYILESREFWTDCKGDFNPEEDLLLTFDFGLKNEVELLRGSSFYVDHLCGRSEMQQNNYLAAEFLKRWHYDALGKDIFTFNGIPFGFAFRIEIWSEYLFYVRLRANLQKLQELSYTALYLGEKNGFIADILDEMAIRYQSVDIAVSNIYTEYYFDIHKYMYDALHNVSYKTRLEDAYIKMISYFTWLMDRISSRVNKYKFVYAQIYHPTKNIVSNLQQDSSIKVITSSLSGGNSLKKYISQRLIPIRGSENKYFAAAQILLSDFREKHNAALIIHDGTDISLGAYTIIEKQISVRVSKALQILDSVIRYVENIPIVLEIMISNLGLLQMIVHSVLNEKKIPSYLVINGLLTSEFCDEGKYATYINGYSESVKKHYFANADNVVSMGDPRMDYYVTVGKKKVINRIRPTVTIGSSGFNNIDLNSYVAVEFDFIFNILQAFQELYEEGVLFNLIIKVRPNAVLEQYVKFVAEYFPKLIIEIVREVPMIEVLLKTDLYITIYSQTLFEASSLGIPVIYYKNDTEINQPPFDGKSELVTVDTVSDLKQAFIDFKADHKRYYDFLDKSIMEKYVGFLDGKNLDRNLLYLYKILGHSD